MTRTTLILLGFCLAAPAAFGQRGGDRHPCPEDGGVPLEQCRVLDGDDGTYECLVFEEHDVRLPYSMTYFTPQFELDGVACAQQIRVAIGGPSCTALLNGVEVGQHTGGQLPLRYRGNGYFDAHYHGGTFYFEWILFEFRQTLLEQAYCDIQVFTIKGLTPGRPSGPYRPYP